ncbi:MAG: hypothetical protein KAI83_05540 [Thiomargarita sp.]|nr:hypothetical protein [Thiomargarita sp.]
MKIFFSPTKLMMISLILFSQVINAKPLSDSSPASPSSKSEYKSLEIKEASITIEIPKNWIQQGKETAWSPNKTGLPLVGFKWTKIEKDDWETTEMLPKNSDFLGPFMLSLDWEEGLLYIVQIKQNEKNSKSLFEIHTVIPRMDAAIAYDLYARATDLTQMKDVELVYQKMRESGNLLSFKEYVSELPAECEDEEFELNCDSSDDEFFDDDGCGCIIAPKTDSVYEN